VMLVEDHVLVREGTRELLDREPDIAVIVEAGDGEEGVRLADAHHPDVVVMDIEMPGLNGLEATKQIKASHPSTAVLVLTAYDDDQYIFAFLAAGAAGYLLKDVRATELANAIRLVHAGESVLHPVIARKVIDYFARPRNKQDQVREAGQAQLTKREMDVLKAAAKGMTNRQIAQRLTISIRTVQVHLTSIFGKLDVGSRTEAILFALREGWLTLDDTYPDSSRALSDEMG